MHSSWKETRVPKEIQHARCTERITRLWNVTNSASPSSCVRMSRFYVCRCVARFQRLSLRSLKWYTAIPHLYVPTKFTIRKENTLAVALPPEVVPLNFPKTIFRSFACFLSIKKEFLNFFPPTIKESQVEELTVVVSKKSYPYKNCDFQNGTITNNAISKRWVWYDLFEITGD